MPSLVETYDTPADEAVQLVRLGLLICLVLGVAAIVGMFLVQFGTDLGTSIGLSRTLAAKLSGFLAMLLAPGGFLWLQTTFDGRDGSVLLAVGIGLTGMAIIGLWMSSFGQAGQSLPIPVMLIYAAGLLGLIAALVRTRLQPRRFGSNPSLPTVDYQRVSSHRGRLPADGGENAEGHLTFPLTDEDR